jgi:biopolymer transport protein ExbB/TolQ
MLKVALLGSAWVLYLLMALSVVSLAAMVERWFFFRRHRDDTEKLRADIAKALLAGDAERARERLAESPSLEARVLREALPWWKGGADAFNDAVDSELSRVQKEIERGTSLLGTLGNNAPFIGLLGTVIGVIEAFREFGAGASKAAMGNVMGGIAEALIATAIGLLVAIPAVVAYNVFRGRVKDAVTNCQMLARILLSQLKSSDAAQPAAAE